LKWTDFVRLTYLPIVQCLLFVLLWFDLMLVCLHWIDEFCYIVVASKRTVINVSH